MDIIVKMKLKQNALVDFKKLNQYNEIIAKLDELGVPVNGVLWDRVLDFAKNYNLYNKKEVNSVDNTFPSTIILSEDQQKAWAKIVIWLKNEERFMLLGGAAGCGKTFLISLLSKQPYDFYFTAPTNKATNVLSKMLGVTAKTTFSQLGIRMSEEEDKLVIDYNATPYMPSNSILVVDECGMVNKELFDFIDNFSKQRKIKVLFTGDKLQLSPIGERLSKTWSCVKSNENYAKLKKVMRHDNQILNLANRMRENIIVKNYEYPIINDNDSVSGVFCLNSQYEFITKIKTLKTSEDFLNNRIICWRNKTVYSYNNIVRKHLNLTETFCTGDVIMIAEPVQEDGVIIASIDEEFKVLTVSITHVKIWYKDTFEIPVYRLDVKNERIDLVLNVPIEETALNQVLTDVSTSAKTSKGRERADLWRKFWSIKHSFNKVRYAFAITAHRSQGSSFKTVFVDAMDILRNSDKKEGYKCLYTAVTRASDIVYSF